ncbi:uncharacterized protein LOC130749237 [Lotus japonicus]|uniref:uncharacterized protein LOC130749237 n=1 Tax=Lotus japonicus TaxID=34305 RepID=UPI0025838F01|nr:uncharacterized protein LOC130749237 [Lotus japonicus]
MGDRKGDARIYVISVLFLACTIGGGVLLFVYIRAPDLESVTLYLIVGMTLVAIPWLFWLLIYMYRCFRPVNVQFDENHHNHIGNSRKGSPKSGLTTSVTSPYGVKSSDHSPASGERRVHFGAIVEMEDGFGGGGCGLEDRCKGDAEMLQHHELKEEHAIPSLVLVEPRESELPLKPLHCKPES